MKYRVPYRLHTSTAKTKATIAYSLEPSDIVAGRCDVLPMPGAPVVEFEADNHTLARMVLQEAILPGDDRPIMGRSNVRFFVVRD